MIKLFININMLKFFMPYFCPHSGLILVHQLALRIDLNPVVDGPIRVIQRGNSVLGECR